MHRWKRVRGSSRKAGPSCQCGHQARLWSVHWVGGRVGSRLQLLVGGSHAALLPQSGWRCNRVGGVAAGPKRRGRNAHAILRGGRGPVHRSRSTGIFNRTKNCAATVGSGLFKESERARVDALWRLPVLPRAKFDATYVDVLARCWRCRAGRQRLDEIEGEGADLCDRRAEGSSDARRMARENRGAERGGAKDSSKYNFT